MLWIVRPYLEPVSIIFTCLVFKSLLIFSVIWWKNMVKCNLLAKLQLLLTEKPSAIWLFAVRQPILCYLSVSPDACSTPIFLLLVPYQQYRSTELRKTVLCAAQMSIHIQNSLLYVYGIILNGSIWLFGALSEGKFITVLYCSYYARYWVSAWICIAHNR